MLCGIRTELGISSTLRDAVDLGYCCITVGDACASAFADRHDVALRMISVQEGLFGIVASTDQIVARLAGGIVV
jgi:nicotinamidase-related amidase